MGATVAVLSPFVGGDYYGALIEGVTRAVDERGDRVIAVQTLDPGAESADRFGVPNFRSPVAWRHVSAFVVVVGAVDQEYVRSIRQTGKPVVLISHNMADVPCPTVVPDNRSGVREAVAHLLEHGHRKIAFVGNLDVEDVRQRYEGYRQALVSQGQTPDPDMLYRIRDNHETGGVQAARQMLRAGLSSTAVVTGTDRNAIGMYDTFASAGHRLPDDQAIVGFDDIPAARYVVPSLTSVYQPLDELAKLAVELLYDQLRGVHVPPGVRHVPTSLVVRESCGCSSGTAPRHLSYERARAQFEEIQYLQTALSTHHQLSMDLLQHHEHDPRNLDWLRRTTVRAGCLALWRSTAVDDDPQVRLAGAFLHDDLPRPAFGQTMPVSAFPPQELFAAAGRSPESIVFVVPVRSELREWGMLSVVTRIQSRTPPGRELMNQSGALLAMALDQTAMLESLRDTEERLRRAACYDHLTGLPNRGMFLDHLTRALNGMARSQDRRLAVLYLDLDGFKSVNDTLGHAAGDQLLVTVAERIAGELRPVDTAARFGGDEFLVLLGDISDPQVAQQIAERLRVAVSRPIELEGRKVSISVSVGVALPSLESETAENLLRNADRAMYRCKSRGRPQAAVEHASC